ncbi:MAG: transglutaminase family protein [Thermodesulfovibrionales bacterium]
MKKPGVMLSVIAVCMLALLSGSGQAKERQGTVTMQVKLNAPADAKNVRIWIPYPMSDKNQDITDVSVSGNFASSAVYGEPRSKSAILYAEWKEPAKERTLTYSFHVKRKEIVRNIRKKEFPLPDGEFRQYLDNSWLGASEAKVKAEAAKITEGRKTVLARAQAIYDWVVDNMRRDPNTKGCGLCDIERLLAEKAGKCADVHSVFTALCRASGVPAREVWGINLPAGREGDMTSMQHCWAEFYLPGSGWIVVDPALVHKAALTKKMTPADLKKAEERRYYFGSIDENRVQLGRAEHVVLNPPQSGAPLIYFMYPYAEADGKPLGEDLFGYNLGYKITFKE